MQSGPTRPQRAMAFSCFSSAAWTSSLTRLGGQLVTDPELRIAGLRARAAWADVGGLRRLPVSPLSQAGRTPEPSNAPR